MPAGHRASDGFETSYDRNIRMLLLPDFEYEPIKATAPSVWSRGASSRLIQIPENSGSKSGILYFVAQYFSRKAVNHTQAYHSALSNSCR